MGNRRKHKRKNLVYYLKVADRETNQAIGHAVNISNKGLMLISEDPIKPESTFQFQMRLPAEIQGGRDFDFAATSIWCEKDESPGFYNIGFEMNNLSAECIQVIKDLVLGFCF